MNKECEEIEELWSEIQSNVYKGYCAVEKMNQALDLGYRANVFQPAYDAFKQSNRLGHRIANLTRYCEILEKENKSLNEIKPFFEVDN